MDALEWRGGDRARTNLLLEREWTAPEVQAALVAESEFEME